MATELTLLQHAARVVIETQFAAPGQIARRLDLPTVDAENLLQQLERTQIVGSADASFGYSRPVLVRFERLAEVVASLAEVAP